MTKDSLPPQDCRTMADVRGAVDAIDAALVDLLVQRFAYMRAAARIKENRAAVRDDERKANVVGQVCQLAEAEGLPSDAIAQMWDTLVEASIAYELAEWDRIKG